MYPSMHWADTPLANKPFPQADFRPGQPPPRAATPPPPGGHCSGRYASYWTAFLYSDYLWFVYNKPHLGADPGFSLGGGTNLRFCQRFTKKRMKLLGRRGGAPPLDPPLPLFLNILARFVSSSFTREYETVLNYQLFLMVF